MKPKLIRLLPLSTAMIILILDSKTAAQGALQGLKLCLSVVIPALFPMMVISSLLMPILLSEHRRTPAFLRSVFHLKEGDAPFLLTGIMGGYPVGAANIAQAHLNKRISGQQAERLLRFCNNAGPSFIFGMGAVIFNSPLLSLLTWLIQIVSSLIVAAICPEHNTDSPAQLPGQPQSNTIRSAINNMALVCGWVILFRVLLTFLEKWILWIFPAWLRITITGLLELTNGVCSLVDIPCMSVRFVLLNGLLAFGGLCVHFQTASVCPGVSIRSHFIGKTQQACIALALSMLLQFVIFQNPIPPTYIIPFAAATFCVIFFSKSYSILRKSHI